MARASFADPQKAAHDDGFPKLNSAAPCKDIRQYGQCLRFGPHSLAHWLAQVASRSRLPGIVKANLATQDREQVSERCDQAMGIQASQSGKVTLASGCAGRLWSGAHTRTRPAGRADSRTWLLALRA